MPNPQSVLFWFLRPVGESRRPADFRIEDGAIPTPGNGQMLLRRSGCHSILICAAE